MKRRVYPKDSEDPLEETKHPFLTEVGAKLAKKFSLTELEVRILLEAKSEEPEEIRKELDEPLLMPVEALVMRSIPRKFEVKTLSEARRKL